MTSKGLISFFSEDIAFQLDNQNNTALWAQKTISKEAKKTGDITYVFCSDTYLHKINLEHLNHDTFTDIITFNYCDGDLISGDIFISIDRVKENAITFHTTFKEELNRVMIHGILHLVGYNDKSDSDKELMRSKEDFYLSLHPK
ncbi:MAG: rRNA maturation RNase YbeY [Flavobacteriales bacterium]|nr:MAG: rRNA maturation RNase YbeY [Flavobacteriales bacterium]